MQRWGLCIPGSASWLDHCHLVIESAREDLPPFRERDESQTFGDKD